MHLVLVGKSMSEPTHPADATKPLDPEAQVAAGTKLLTAMEIAPRLGLRATDRGVRSVRKLADDGVIPGWKVGGNWMFHWPSVIAKRFPQPKR